MKTHSTKDTLVLGAPLAEAKAAVILLHGRGSSGEDIAGLAEVLKRPDIAYLAPTATNGTWYPQRFLAPLAENEPWLSSALSTVHELVVDLNSKGFSSERIGIAGFSQGACLAIEYVARNPARYLFAATMSGALIGPLDTPRPQVDLQGTPVLVASAEEDPHIPKAFVEHSATLLSSFGAQVTKWIFPGGGHTVFPPEVEWLQERLSGSTPAAAKQGS